MGIIPGDIRSLSSLFLHLAPQPNSLPGVNLTRLQDWVRDVLGDAVLADAIREAVEASQSHVDGCLRVYELVAVRLAQAEEVASERPLRILSRRQRKRARHEITRHLRHRRSRAAGRRDDQSPRRRSRS